MTEITAAAPTPVAAASEELEKQMLSEVPAEAVTAGDALEQK